MRLAAGRLGVLATIALCAAFSVAAGDDDVVGPEQVRQGLAASRALQEDASAKVAPLGNGEWFQDVYVLSYTFGSTYDRRVAGSSNPSPRQWVSQSFFLENPDAYDFLVVFTNFDWNAGDNVRGLYWSIANDVSGIGLDLFDLSDQFGSENLQGYIDAILLSDYLLSDGSLDESRIEQILNHEMGHRWLVYPTFDAGGSPSLDLLGLDQAHWSYLLDTDASVLYGAEWTANGDGTFTATSTRQGFSPLGLYLMGFNGPDEVPPLTLLRNPAISGEQLPGLGDTITATPEIVTVDQVIAAEGPRSPTADEARNELRLGIVYLVDPAIPFTLGEIESLQSLRDFWEQSFFRRTGGRGVIDIDRHGEPPFGRTDADLQLAIEWLAGLQAGSGLWQDSTVTTSRDTAEAIEALSRTGGRFDAVDLALGGLPGAEAANGELRARRLEALARWSPANATGLADAVEAEESSEGGWPSYPRYSGDAVTTGRAVRALVEANRVEAAQRGWAWLQTLQNEDGGWGWQPDGTSATTPTLEALLAARALQPADFWTLPAVQDGVAWLMARRSSGGLGDAFPNVADTALFLLLTLDQAVDQRVVQDAVDFLAARQEETGGWESSVYKTALAINALISFALPDPFVDASEVFADPSNPFDDEFVTLTAAVRNGGRPLEAGVEYAWEIVLAGDPTTPVETLTGVLPAIGDSEFVTVSDMLPAGLAAGPYEVRFHIDPERKISEKSRQNNIATIPLPIRSHPDGIDLAFETGDVTVSPDDITSMPQAVTVSGMLRNIGLQNAGGAVVSVFDGDPTAGRLLGSTTVDVTALSATPFSVPVMLDEARPYVLSILADPDDLFSEADRFNNRASLELILRLTTDLEIADFTASPGGIMVGQELMLDVEIHNGGTTAVDEFQIELRYETGGTSFLIEFLNVAETVQPNGSLTVQTVWVPNVAGAPLILTAEVDPQGALGDVDLSDNSASTTVDVLASALPNLRVTVDSFAFVPDPPLQGQDNFVTATISNPTPNDAGAFDAELWLDAVTTGTLLTTQSFAGLAAGETLDLTATWDVAEPEDRLVYVVVDPGAAIVEFNEDDNEAFIEPDVQTLPDLAVTSGGVSFMPDFPRVGDTVLFDVLVANQGDQPAPGSLLELVDGDGTVIDSVAVPPLEGHTEVVLDLSWDTGVTPGEAQLSVRVDASFPELETANNVASFTIGVQNAELFVSNQIFSPNGDGVKDTTTFFFRNGAESVEIIAGDGLVTRTLEVPEGAASVEWDGMTDRGNLARDALYEVQVGDRRTWVVVDNNLFSVTTELDQVLLVGFLQPEVPGFEEERSFFTSMISNPLIEEIYLVERFHAEGTSSDDDEITLRRWDGDEIIDVGEYPEGDRPLISSNTAGDTFTAGRLDSGSYRLVTYPGPTVRSLIPPGEFGYDPYISPDGRWILWASSSRASVVLEDVDDSSNTITFDPDPFPRFGICGYSVNFTRRGAVVSVNTFFGFGYYYDITLGESPEARVEQAENWTLGCSGRGGGELSQSPRENPEKAAKAGVGLNGPQSAVDLERDRITWVVASSDYGEYESSRPAADEEKFIVSWSGDESASEAAASNSRTTRRGRSSSGSLEAPETKGFREVEIEVAVFDRLDGSELESATLATGTSIFAFPPPVASLSNDGFVIAYTTSDDYGGGDYERFDQRLLYLEPPDDETGAPDFERAAKMDSPVGQFLVRWDSGDVRPMPLRLEQALWTPVDKFLIGSLDVAPLTEGTVPYFTPAANLTTQVRPRVLFGDAGVDLWILVTDRYLDNYRLEYADLDDLSTYFPIGLPSDEPLLGERWGTWIPPGNGRYRVRLTATDRAGNVRLASKRVTWNGDNDIANLYLENRYVSPRSSPGVQDEMIFHYTVLRPANLEFTITDEAGNPIVDIAVAADQIGPRSTTWSGDDSSGNPVADGRYLLTYGEASWPFVVDNSPPEVTLRIEDTRLVQNELSPRRNLLINELFAGVRDDNLEDWEYQTLDLPGSDWLTEVASTTPLERDGDKAWRVLGASELVSRDLRIVARDLAGNSTISVTRKRDERLIFADSEPVCRSLREPCLYPERPALEELIDTGGIFDGPDQVLNTFYDTLLVQSTVWTGDLDLELEYRRATLGGLPPGPWQGGVIQAAPSPTRRGICALGLSTVSPPVRCAFVSDSVQALYWDHPELPLVPHDVRLTATNDDGQRISSQPLLFLPEVPLVVEYLGVDASGHRFRVTNASNSLVSSVRLETREMGNAGEFWASRVSVSGRLAPGQFAEVATQCVLVPHGGKLIRAAGNGSLGEDAVSLPVELPRNDGFARLAAPFSQSRCVAGPKLGDGFHGVQHSQPCSSGSPLWPQFWITNGEPATIFGGFPTDPTGVLVESYELQVDGMSRLRIEGPLDAASYQEVLDLRDLPEGGYQVREVYTYSGEPGLLGTCPQTFPLTIDRTPPEVTIDSPSEGDLICPADFKVDVALSVADDSTTNHRISLDGRAAGGNRFCSPYSGPGGTFEVDVKGLAPGIYELGAHVADKAGNSNCTSINVVVPDLPNVRLSASPLVFSPVNTLDRPIVEEISFTTGTPGDYELQITDLGGTLLQIQAGTVDDGEEEVFFAWDGTDISGALMPDGIYRVTVLARSPCGAEDTASRAFELDTTPPDVLLTAPEPGALVGATLEFKGLANDQHFERYQLQVLSQDAPGSDWVTVQGMDQPRISAAQSLGVWNTAAFVPGDYLVRMIANDEPGNEAMTPEIPVTLRERRFILRFERQPEIFSPNGDGIFDQAELLYELLQDATLSLRAVDDDGDVLATMFENQLTAHNPGGTTLQWGGQADAGGILADGTYDLVLTAEDPLVPPTLESETETLTITIDTTPPVLEIVNPVEGSLSGLPLAVSASLDELHPDEWLLDLELSDGTRVPLVSGSEVFMSRRVWEINDRPDGAYALIFEAVDLAGNRSELRREFAIDNTAPAVQILEPAGGAVLNTTTDYLLLTGEIVEENLVSYSWSYAVGTTPLPEDFMTLDEGTSTGAGGLVEYRWDASRLGDGPYTLRLAATDQPGRESEARLIFVVDNTPPEVAITAPTAGAVVSDDVDVDGSVADDNLEDWQLEVAAVGGSTLSPPLANGFTPVNGTLTTWSALPVDGSYELTLFAEDAAGNTADVSVTVEVQVVPPGPPVLVSAEIEGRQNVVLVWQAGVGAPPAGYNVYRDGARINSTVIAETTTTDEALPEGIYTYTVRAVSARGTESDDSNSLAVEIDLSLPVARISAPADGSRVSDQVSVRGTAYRETNLAGWRLQARAVPNGTWLPLGSGTASVLADLLAVWDTALPQWPDGIYELRLEVEDTFGNLAVDQALVEVDNTPSADPLLTVAFAFAQGADTLVDDIHVEWALDPVPGDLAGYYLYRNGLLANAPGPVIGSPEPFLLSGTNYDDQDLPDGTYVYWVIAADTAGNESAASNESDPITIDTRRPHAVIVDPPDGSSFEQSTPVLAEVEDLDVVAVQFEFMPDGAGSWTPLGDPLTERPYIVDFAPGASGLYHLRAIASDATGPDPAPESISLTETDQESAAPVDLSLQVDGCDIHLQWPAVPDPSGDLEGYLVYRNGVVITPTPLATTQVTFDDLDLAEGFYTYEVTAIDLAGNESEPSPSRGGYVETPTFEHIHPVTSAATLALAGNSEFYFASVDLEKENAAGDFEVVATISSAETEFVFPLQPLAYGFQVFRFVGNDGQGNRSKPSREMVILRHDVPPVPADLEAMVDGQDVTVSWQGSGDSDFEGFDLWRDDALQGVVADSLTYDSATHDLQASAGALGEWQRVVDGLATDPGWSPDPGVVAEWQWTWPDSEYLTEVAMQWSSMPASRYSVEIQVDGYWLWWSYRSFNSATLRLHELGVRATGIRIVIPSGYCLVCSLNEVTLSTATRTVGSPYLDASLADGAYLYEVAELNRFGQSSNLADVVALVGGGEPPPPLDLTATPQGCGEIALAWLPPPPFAGAILGFRLYRAREAADFELLVEMLPGTTGHLDTGLELDTTYRYRVTVVAEVAGQAIESAPTAEAVALTECPSLPPPVLLEPTVAGMPIDWPTRRADIGGRGFPGSIISLQRDGVEVAATLLDEARPDMTYPLPGFGTYSADLDLSADGRYAAYLVDDSAYGIAWVDLESDSQTIFAAGEPEYLAISPNGDRIAYVGYVPDQNDLFLLDTATGTSQRLTTDEDEEDYVAFSPDGRRLAYIAFSVTTFRDEVRILDLVAGTQTMLYTHSFRSLTEPAWSPDGRYLAISTGEGPKIIDVTTGAVRSLFRFSRMFLTNHPFSPDSRYLVWAENTLFSIESAVLQVYDLVERTITRVSPGVGEFAGTFLDERTLAFLRLEAGGAMVLGSRSLADDQETVLSRNLTRFHLPSFDRARFNLFALEPGKLRVPQGERLVELVRPSGHFVFPDMALEPGQNFFTAVQELGDDVQESLPIEIRVEPDLFPDAEVVSLTATPGFPLSGDSVLIEGVVRNAGQANLDDAGVTLRRISPAGVVDTVFVDTISLAGDASTRVRYLWSTGAAAGDFIWRLAVDPSDQIVELDEGNNVELLTVPLRNTVGVGATVATDRLSYFRTDIVVLRVTVTANDVPRDTLVTTVIETAEGEFVATVDERTLPDFGFDTVEFVVGWPVDVFPGDYWARVVVDREKADAEASAPFDVAARLGAEAEGTADRPAYRRGATANFQALVRNIGDVTLRDATVRMNVTPIPAGTPVATEERSVSALGAGDPRRINWAWSTSPAAPGAYELRVTLVDTLGLPIAAAAPYPFVITAAGADLAGRLAMAPTSLEPGGTIAVTANVDNLGDEALSDVDFFVDVVDPVAGTAHARLTSNGDLGVGGALELTWDYSPDMLLLRPYVAVLSAVWNGGSNSEQLATASFTLIDLTPPALELLEPAGPVCDSRVRVRARAVDQLSSVLRAYYHQDGSLRDLPLLLESVEDTVYAGEVFLEPGVTERVELDLFAEDTVGNGSLPMPVAIESINDGQPPVLNLAGPADGACVNAAAFTWAVDDRRLASTVATLEGAIYSAGTAIVGDGLYEFSLAAEDVCALASEEVRRFTLDTVAPTVDVVGVDEGGLYGNQVSFSWTGDDLNLTEINATLDGLPITSPHTVSDAGIYALSVSAVDCAGNRITVDTSFEVIPATVEIVGDLMLDPAEVEPPAGFTADANVRNNGRLPVDGVNASLRLIDPSSGAVLAEQGQNLDLASGAEVPVVASFDTNGLTPGTYLVTLTAAGDLSRAPFEQQLAAANLQIVDRTPPAVTIIAPAAGAVCNPVMVEVEVADALSAIAEARMTIDGGGLTVLERDPLQTVRYTTLLDFAPDSLGAHRLAFVAEDAAGNASGAIELDVVTDDGASPTISLSGPAAGACVATPPVVTFGASDGELDSVTATVDGVPFASGATITGDGLREILVVARDLCSLTSQESLRFTIDTVNPVIEVTGVDDGEIYSGTVTASWDVNDLNLEDVEATLDGLAVTSPLTVSEIGVHVLEISGVDCAGNRSELSVAFEIDDRAPGVIEIPTLDRWFLLALALALALLGWRRLAGLSRHTTSRQGS